MHPLLVTYLLGIAVLDTMLWVSYFSWPGNYYGGGDFLAYLLVSTICCLIWPAIVCIIVAHFAGRWLTDVLR